MIYTKPWEYRLGMTMLFFSSAVVIFMLVLAIIRLTEGNMIAFLFLALGALNATYALKYFDETKEYRRRRRLNG